MRSRSARLRVALSYGQLAARFLVGGALGLLLGAVACFYGFSSMFGGAPSGADVLVPVGLFTLLASAISLVAGLVFGIIALARKRG